MIPRCLIGEIVEIYDKPCDFVIYNGKVTMIYPKQVKSLTHEEAIRDGFSHASECKHEIMRINGLKSIENWVFVIRWHEIVLNK